jgi:hypothetical protein
MRSLFRLWVKQILSAVVKYATSPNALVFPTGVLGLQAANALLQGVANVLSASGAINPHQSALYAITKAGVAAMTLAAPTAGTDDNVIIEVFSTTAYAHTITTPAAGDIRDGNTSDHDTVCTFNAHIGANLRLRAYNGVWYVENEVGCSLTS